MRVMQAQSKSYATQYPTSRCELCDGTGMRVRELPSTLYPGETKRVAGKCPCCNGKGRIPFVGVDFKSRAAGDNA